MHRNHTHHGTDRSGDYAHQPFHGNDDDRYGRTESMRGPTGYGAGYGAGGYEGYRGTDDRSHQSAGYDDRGFGDRSYDRGYGDRHVHDEHERGRWGQDYDARRGHRYQGGMIDDADRYRRDEYQSQRWPGHYQDRDERGRFTDTGEGPSYRRSYGGHDRGGQMYSGGYDRDYERGPQRDDRGRFGGYEGRARSGYESSYLQDRNERMRYEGRGGRDDRGGYDRGGYERSMRDDRGGYDRGGYDRGGHDRGGYDRGGYGRGGYGRDERSSLRGSDHDDQRFGRHGTDHDRRWVGGGYEEDRRGRR